MFLLIGYILSWYMLLGTILYIYGLLYIDSDTSDLEQTIFFTLSFIFRPILFLIIFTEELIKEYKFRKEIKKILKNTKLSKHDKQDIISVLEDIRYGEFDKDDNIKN